MGLRKTKANWRVITPNVEMNPDVPKIGHCDAARSRDAIRKRGFVSTSAELMRSAAVGTLRRPSRVVLLLLLAPHSNPKNRL